MKLISGAGRTVMETREIRAGLDQEGGDDKTLICTYGENAREVRQER